MRRISLFNTTMPSSSIYNLLDDSIVKSPIPKMHLSFPPGLNVPCRCAVVIVPLVVKDRMRGTVHSHSTNPTHKNPKPDLLSYFGGSRSRVVWKHFWLFARISGCPCSQKQMHHFNNIQ